MKAAWLCTRYFWPATVRRRVVRARRPRPVRSLLSAGTIWCRSVLT